MSVQNKSVFICHLQWSGPSWWENAREMTCTSLKWCWCRKHNLTLVVTVTDSSVRPSQFPPFIWHMIRFLKNPFTNRFGFTHGILEYFLLKRKYTLLIKNNVLLTSFDLAFSFHTDITSAAQQPNVEICTNDAHKLVI